MTPFPEGGSSLYRSKRLAVKPIIVLLVAVSILLGACGRRVSNQNWPGITTSGDAVFVAYGNGVAAVNIPEQELQWTFPDEMSASLLFYAQPSVHEDRVVIGDYGASGGMFSPRTTVSIYALGRPENAGAPPSLLWVRDDVATDRIIAPALQTDRQVFVGTADNHLYAFEAETGELQWEFPTDHSIWAQPEYTEGYVYVASLDNSVYALDPNSGELKWETALEGSVAGHPVLSEGLLYVPSFDRQLHALNANSGEELWAADAANWVWGSPAVGGGSVFYGDIDGNIYAVSAATGESQWTATVSGAVQSALLYDDGVVFVSSGETEGEEEQRGGALTALDAEQGDVIWQAETAAPVFSAPVMVGDSIVIVFQPAEGPVLNVFDREDGALAWEFMLPAASQQ